MQSKKLTSLQLELLKIYSFQPSEADLIAIKQLLANYFSDKLTQNIQNGIERKGLTNNDLDSWVN
jgi:hypothetical protein